MNEQWLPMLFRAPALIISTPRLLARGSSFLVIKPLLEAPRRSRLELYRTKPATRSRLRRIVVFV